MVAGHSVDIGVKRVSCTAWALRLSGTTTLKALALIIAGTVSVAAWVGVSSNDGNQPSPTCWRLHAPSSGTILTNVMSLKLATGGSLNAMWPFSPIPMQARSMSFSMRRLE